MKNSIDLRKNRKQVTTNKLTTFFVKVSFVKLIIFIAMILIVSSANAQAKKNNINDVPQTKKIVSIEYGVTCGKTGKPAVYVYFKKKGSAGFNVSTDREIVYTQNIASLQNTVQYKSYIK
ncbi:hypothetical protein [Flavobacterium phage FL-1]|nr:hypothetical protein [Flavobacterium phage FL-1]